MEFRSSVEAVLVVLWERVSNSWRESRVRCFRFQHIDTSSPHVTVYYYVLIQILTEALKFSHLREHSNSLIHGYEGG